jgi:hypothetical protein
MGVPNANYNGGSTRLGLETFGTARVAPTYRLVVAATAETIGVVAKTLNDTPSRLIGELLACQIVGVF